MFKSIFRFILIFLVVGLIVWLSANGEYYEDRIYFYYAQSVMADFDFNIINQAPQGFSEIITKNYSHPAHHSVIQTPLLVFFMHLKPENVGGIILSMVSLLIGFIYTQKAAQRLKIELRAIHLIVFLSATALLYFSFLTVTVLEIFLFALSAFTFDGLIQLNQKNLEELDGFSFGAASAMLLTAKITFAPLFILGAYYVFADLWRSRRRFVLNFIVSSSLVFLIAFLKDYASFGEIVSISQAMTEFTTEYSWLNLFVTLRYGVFGTGGIFYSNPLYALSLIGFILLFIQNIKSNKRSLSLWITLSLWMLMSFFQTIFIVGPMLEDHYVGRLALLSLPLMLLGLATLEEKLRFSGRKFVIYGVYIVLILCQFYTLGNFLTLSAQGHYDYAFRKTVEEFSTVTNYLSAHAVYNWELLTLNFGIYFLFITLATLIIVLIIHNRSKLSFALRLYFYYAVSLLLIVSISNQINSKENGIKFLEQNNLMNEVTIGEDYSIYSFNYIVDILRSQLYNTNNEKLRKIIKAKHKTYLEHVAPYARSAKPKLRKALETDDLEYGYYQ